VARTEVRCECRSTLTGFRPGSKQRQEKKGAENACDFKGQFARILTDLGIAYVDHTGKIVWQGKGIQ